VGYPVGPQPEEKVMDEMNRRSALTLGLAAAVATPLFVLATPAGAAAPTYGPNDGKEVAPGVRVVEVSTADSVIPAYKSLKIIDVVFQPGAVAPESVMDNDMICHITAGEFKIKKGPLEFIVKEDGHYTCTKGKTDMATNISKVVGVHRIAILIPA
jgi:quercetin dioxygenase-like cupin family protein